MSGKRAKEKRKILKKMDSFKTYMGDYAEEAFYQLGLDEEEFLGWAQTAMFVHEQQPEIPPQNLLPNEFENTLANTLEIEAENFLDKIPESKEGIQNLEVSL